MIRAVALLFALVSAIVVGAMWLLWEALVLLARAVPVVAVWIFWELAWLFEAVYDIGFWIGSQANRLIYRERGSDER